VEIADTWRNETTSALAVPTRVPERLATQRSVLDTIRALDCNQLCYRDFAIRSRFVELEAVGLVEI
jgi:hypothetical protein